MESGPETLLVQRVKELLVSDAIIGVLEDEAVEYVFGVPGSTTVSLISAIARSEKLHFVPSLHENASMGMADGFARESGEISVVLLHTTPGLTTALPNLYNAFVDDLPVLVIVGDVNSKSLIREPGLALNGMIDIVKPMSRWSYHASSPSDALVALRRSINILRSSEPGPCCIIIPEDILEQEMGKETRHYENQEGRKTMLPDRKRVEQIVQSADQARWPILIVGREIKSEKAVNALVEFCSKYSIPVLLESPYPSAYYVGFPQDHPCYVGLFRREFLKEADLVIALGGQVFTERKFYEESPLSSETKLIHIHSNPWELGKNYVTHTKILADPQEAAAMFLEVSQNFTTSNEENRKIRQRKMADIRKQRETEQENLLSRKKPNSDHVESWTLVDVLRKTLNGRSDFVIVDEGVVASSYLAELFHFSKPGTLIGRSAGCLGWGISAAVGVKLASPNKKVIAFVGDGALFFGPQAIWTAAHFGLPITIIVCNNSGYASVSLSFESFARKNNLSFEGESGIEITGVDIKKLCEGFGAKCTSVKDENDLLPTIRKALDANNLEVVDIRMDPKEKGYEGSVGKSSSWT